MTENVESADGPLAESTDIDSCVYKYTGQTDGTDVVAAVKAHHAYEEGCSSSDLIGRKLTSGGRDVEVTYVVIVEWET
jgi:hypothetical protein